MKNFLFCVIAITGITSFTLPTGLVIKNDSVTTNLQCHYGQCNKIKKDGNRCGNCAQQNSSYCWSHNN